jgi:hypothetical protein
MEPPGTCQLNAAVQAGCVPFKVILEVLNRPQSTILSNIVVSQDGYLYWQQLLLQRQLLTLGRGGDVAVLMSASWRAWLLPLVRCLAQDSPSAHLSHG